MKIKNTIVDNIFFLEFIIVRPPNINYNFIYIYYLKNIFKEKLKINIKKIIYFYELYNHQLSLVNL